MALRVAKELEDGTYVNLGIGIPGLVSNWTDGRPKIVKQCTYPITAVGCVKLIVTNLAVIEVVKEGLVLKEVYPGLTPEVIQSVTEPKLIIAPDLKEIEL